MCFLAQAITNNSLDLLASGLDLEEFSAGFTSGGATFSSYSCYVAATAVGSRHHMIVCFATQDSKNRSLELLAEAKQAEALVNDGLSAKLQNSKDDVEKLAVKTQVMTNDLKKIQDMVNMMNTCMNTIFCILIIIIVRFKRIFCPFLFVRSIRNIIKCEYPSYNCRVYNVLKQSACTR